MMNIILATGADYMSIPAAQKLKNDSMLACIVIPGKHKQRLMRAFIQAGFSEDVIYPVYKDDFAQVIIDLTKQYNANSVFVITFPWKIPSEVLAAPKFGFINFHPGLMPLYKGADPIYWQIRNREQFGGITVHRMTEELDAGPIILEHKIPIIPGETYGIHHVRLGVAAADIVLKVAAEVQSGTFTQQDTGQPSPYFKKPTKQQVSINWEQHTAQEIEALVNATNPKYNGAFTSIRNMQVSILDASFADISNPPKDAVPGTIIYADALYGLIVACTGGEYLRINTFCMPEGYLSGSKMFAMGFNTGEKFH